MKQAEPNVHIPITHLHAVRMSNRQYGELRYIQSAPRGVINLEQVSQLNQLTLGGNKRRGWIVETPKRDGVMITYEGREALKAFENGDFTRQVASMRFSSFLSLDVYEEPVKPKKKGQDKGARPRTVREAVVEIKKRRAGA